MRDARVAPAFLTILLSPPLVAGLAKVSDTDALIALYENTGGASWALQSGAPGDLMMQPGGNAYWGLSASDPCPLNFTEAWQGVACEDPCYAPIDGDDCHFGRITGLQLPFNNLVGTIPPEVFDKLINLTVFDVSHNQLSGTIPTQVGKLRNLMCACHQPRSAPCGYALMGHELHSACAMPCAAHASRSPLPPTLLRTSSQGFPDQ